MHDFTCFLNLFGDYVLIVHDDGSDHELSDMIIRNVGSHCQTSILIKKNTRLDDALKPVKVDSSGQRLLVRCHRYLPMHAKLRNFEHDVSWQLTKKELF